MTKEKREAVQDHTVHQCQSEHIQNPGKSQTPLHSVTLYLVVISNLTPKVEGIVQDLQTNPLPRFVLCLQPHFAYHSLLCAHAHTPTSIFI